MVCSINGHQYLKTRTISPTIHELMCVRCKEEFAINQYVKSVLPLDEELRQLHSMLQR